MTQPSIEVLVERVTALVGGLERMEQNLADQRRVMDRVPLIERDVHELEAKVRSHADSIALHSTAITSGKTSGRIIGAIASAAAIAAVSTTGWAWNQLDSLHRADNDVLVRVTRIEVKSEEADKLKGYVRANN